MIRRVLMQLAALASALALAYVAWLSGRNLPAAIALVAFLSFAIAIYASADGRKRQRLAEGLADALFEAEDDDDGEGHEPGEALAHLRRFLLGVVTMTAGCAIAYFAWSNGLRVQAVVGFACFMCFAFSISSRASATRRRDEEVAQTPVADELAELESAGFVVLHNVPFAKGDVADYVLSGPNGAFLVDSTSDSCDAYQLGIVKRKARRLQDQLRCSVTPVICAGVRQKPSIRKDVLVAGRLHLTEAIRTHRGYLPPSPEQVARLSTRLA
jgi:hypothetical protein